MTARLRSRASTTISSAYLRLRRPHMRAPGGPCPIGILAQASYDDPAWAFLSDGQKRDWTDFDHYDLARPDFLSWHVDDLPHKIPFLVKELTGAPIMVWTVHTPEQREAAHKWADQIVFDGDPEAHRAWRPISYVGSLGIGATFVTARTRGLIRRDAAIQSDHIAISG